VALLAALAAGIALSGVEWCGLWSALIAKGLAVAAVYAAVLFAAERRSLLEVGRWLWKALGFAVMLDRLGVGAGRNEPERSQIE
jgi:hypothetical protein